jgi:hypothetical protein
MRHDHRLTTVALRQSIDPISKWGHFTSWIVDSVKRIVPVPVLAPADKHPRPHPDPAETDLCP